MHGYCMLSDNGNGYWRIRDTTFNLAILSTHIKKWVIIWARSHLFTRNDTLGQYIISMEEH